MSHQVPPPQGASLSAILTFAVGSLPIAALGLAMAISVQPYYAQIGVPLVTIGIAFSVVRVIDVGADISLAVLMDRTRTPIGRYRPWLLAGAPILMLGVYMLFFAGKGIGLAFLIVWLLVYALGNSIVTLARNAWSATLVTRYDHRSLFYGLLALAGIAGSLLIIATPIVSAAITHSKGNNVQLMGWIALALIPICLALAAVFVPERISADAPSNRVPLADYIQVLKNPELRRLFISSVCLTLGPNWMANLYLFYFIANRGFSESQAYILLGFYIAAGVVGGPAIGWIGARISKHRTMIAATVCYSLGLCSVVITPRADLLAGVPVMLWCGANAAGFDLLTSAMMADLGDQIRLDQGKERMALLFAVQGLAAKLAAAAAVAIAYPLLALVGFEPTRGAHNTPAALDGLQWVFILGPIFFVVLGGLCFIGWRLDAHRHAEIRTELEARDAQLAQLAMVEQGGI